MTRTIRLAVTIATLALALFLLAPGPRAHSAPPAVGKPTIVRVLIQSYSFKPSTITIAPGTTVMWINKDATAHTVTSKTRAWPDTDKYNLDSGHSVSISKPFMKTGTYTYYCKYHPFMVGKVVVKVKK